MSIQLKDLRQISKKCNEERFHTLFDFCSSKRDILLVLMCIEKFKKVEHQPAMASAAPFEAAPADQFVHLISTDGNSHIGVIKTIRTYTNLSLKEAKDIADDLRYKGSSKSLGPFSSDRAAQIVRELRQNGCLAEVHMYR